MTRHASKAAVALGLATLLLGLAGRTARIVVVEVTGVPPSRDPPLLGPPACGNAQFTVGPAGGRTTLRLRYFKS